MIRECQPVDFETIYEIINDAAQAYKGVIAADCWHEPYMARNELRHEIAQGVRFWAVEEKAHLVAVMGLQNVQDVALIRHAYTRSTCQQRGHGSALLAHLQERTERPMLVGTWKAAHWAIRFYESHRFRNLDAEETVRLLRRYWTVSPRQIEESVVLADANWQGAS
jgi:N-acetylglutamate synthase-like GNAT family acetyltransferase